MAGINLLPWREQLRKERRKRFVVALAGGCVLAVAIIVVVDRCLDAAVARQSARNAYLQAALGQLDVRIKQLDDIKLQRRQLLERMQVIQGLQGGRSNMAQLLDQLTRTLPEGVYFTALKRSGQTLSITGKADSNNRVSQLMRNLEASAQFQMPSLTRVKAAGDNVSAQAGTFELTVGQDPAGLGQ